MEKTGQFVQGDYCETIINRIFTLMQDSQRQVTLVKGQCNSNYEEQALDVLHMHTQTQTGVSKD